MALICLMSTPCGRSSRPPPQLMPCGSTFSATCTTACPHAPSLLRWRRGQFVDILICSMQQFSRHLLSTYHETLTPPFCIPSRWIVYQMLHGLAQCHEAGVCHGDLKAENCLLTSWSWVLIADFAPYKPTFLPADNPVSHSLALNTAYL